MKNKKREEDLIRKFYNDDPRNLMNQKEEDQPQSETEDTTLSQNRDEDKTS